MANKTQAAKRTSGSPWLPTGANGRNGHKAPAKPRGSTEFSEWLLAGKPRAAAPKGTGRPNGSNGRHAHPAAKPATRAPQKRHRLPKRASAHERWLVFRLRRSQKRERELRDHIEELQARVSELEAHNGHGNGNGNGNGAETPKHSNGNGNGKKPKRTPAAKRTSTAPARRRKPHAASKRSRQGATRSARKPMSKAGGRRATSGRSRRSKVDLNAATFDQLRGLGLSITQTSRLISHREMAGGFTQVDELDEIKGLPRATVADLRSHVRVGSR